MAVTSFIPELWSARLLHALDKAHVATAFVNRDYEGEIKEKGDTVHVNFIGPVTIKDYGAEGADTIDGPQNLNTTGDTLVIDQAKYFNFKVKDVDKAQAAGDLMDAAMGRAGYGMAEDGDTFIFNMLSNGASKSINPATTAYESCVALGAELDKNNVSKIGRKLAVNADMYAELLLDPRFAGNGNASQEFAFNGYVGMVAGFEVYETNNLPSTLKALAATQEGGSYAEQLTEIDAYRPQNDFADAVKGLHLYGGKVFRPECIVTLKATATE